MRFKVLLEPDPDGGFVVRCPALPGCVSQGETQEEALANLKEAIEGVLLVMNERAQTHTSTEELVEVEV